MYIAEDWERFNWVAFWMIISGIMLWPILFCFGAEYSFHIKDDDGYGSSAPKFRVICTPILEEIKNHETKPESPKVATSASSGRVASIPFSNVRWTQDGSDSATVGHLIGHGCPAWVAQMYATNPRMMQQIHAGYHEMAARGNYTMRTVMEPGAAKGPSLETTMAGKSLGKDEPVAESDEHVIPTKPRPDPVKSKPQKAVMSASPCPGGVCPLNGRRAKRHARNRG